MFIYKISNNTNGKIYIGITTKTVLNRFQRHCVIARTSNKHNKKYLHYAMMKYGWINFSVGTIEECNSIEELKERESFWIKELDSNNPKIGYNLTKGGTKATAIIGRKTNQRHAAFDFIFSSRSKKFSSLPTCKP